MQWRTLIAVAVVAVALTACTRYPPELYGFDFDNAYLLDAGDEIRIVVYEVDNLPQVFRVDASGHVSMPMAGVINVRGKTVQQVERAVIGRLRDRFIKDPKVSVQVMTYRPLYVLGEVKNAGQFAFVNGMTVELLRRAAIPNGRIWPKPGSYARALMAPASSRMCRVVTQSGLETPFTCPSGGSDLEKPGAGCRDLDGRLRARQPL
jgi:polysaccharide export outer membrane protein